MFLLKQMGGYIGKTLVLEQLEYEKIFKKGQFLLESHIRGFPALAGFPSAGSSLGSWWPSGN